MMGQTATYPDCLRREDSWRIYLIARVSSESRVAFKSAHCGQFRSRNYPCWCLLLACYHQGCELMRQSPNDQIVRIESELREETLHSSTVPEAPGMSEAPRRLRDCIHHCPQPRPHPPHVEPSFCPFPRMDYLRHWRSSFWTASAHLPLNPPHRLHHYSAQRLYHRHDRCLAHRYH
jgi:hypothetical protein